MLESVSKSGGSLSARHSNREPSYSLREFASVVMEILGHSQIALTMNTYTHLLSELKRDPANRMETAIQDLER